MTDLNTPNTEVPQAQLPTAEAAADAWFAGIAAPVDPITTPVQPQVTIPTPAQPQVTIPTPVQPQVTTPAPVQPPTQQPEAAKPFYQFTQQERDMIVNSLPQDMRTPYEKSLPVIAEVAQRMVEHALNNGVASKFNQFEQFAAQQNDWQDQQFESAIQQHVPNVDGLINDPNFAQYLDTPIPYSGGMTPRKALLAAYDNRNLSGVTDVFAGYAARTAQAAPQPTPSVHHTSPYANVPPARANVGGNTIPMSAVTKAQADFSAGRITRDVFGVLLSKFEAAQRAGLIDPSR